MSTNEPPNRLDGAVVETRATHYYQAYGRTFTGYGPSMDPHRCGHPDEPCHTVTEQRLVTPWTVVSDIPTPTVETAAVETSAVEPPAVESSVTEQPSRQEPS